MSEDIALTVGLFLLFYLILWVANLAEKRRQNDEPYQGLAMVSYLTLSAFYVALGLLVQGFGTILATQPQLLEDLGLSDGQGASAAFNSFALFSIGAWLPTVLGIPLLLPPVRRLVARFFPIDPASPVHAVALSLIALVAMNLLVTLGIGLNTLATMLEAQAAEGAEGVTLLSLWVQQILTAVFGIIGVGWLARRDLPAALKRLGIVVPTLRQVVIGVGLALVLVPVILALEYATSVWGLGENPDVEKLTEQLLGPLFGSPFGVLTIGLAAGLGEETLMRGALQPRFGLLLTSLIFALMHNNYGFSMSTIVVFGLGLILGLVRMRANTTTSMIVHAVYNSTLGVLAYLNV